MKLKAESGITGIDITVSITLISIFIALIATITYNIQKKSADIERLSEATMYAVELVEEIKSGGFDILPAKGTNTIENYEPGYILDNEGKETPYYQEIQVLDYTELPGNESKVSEILKKVTVNVKYMSGSKEKTVELSTIISKEN